MAYKTLFLGTPEITLPFVNSLINHPDIELEAVISMPSRPFGRKQDLKDPAVIELAKEKNIPFFQTADINQELDLLEQLKDTDLCFVFAFAQFLKKSWLNLPRRGCFNLHTSLLPRYRGAAPIQYALLNGDAETGVTLQKMVKKMDAGDIAEQETVAISTDDNSLSLSRKLSEASTIVLNRFIQNLKANKLKFIEQNESDVCFAPSLKKEDGLLSFKHKTAEEIYNQWRAFHPWPGSFCYLEKKRLKILKLSLYKSSKLTPSQCQTQMGMLIVGCKQGAVRLEQVQLEGKKMTSDTDFLRGLRTRIESL